MYVPPFSSSQVQTPNDDFLSGLCCLKAVKGCLKAELDSSTSLFPNQCYRSGSSVNVISVEIFHVSVTVAEFKERYFTL